MTQIWDRETFYYSLMHSRNKQVTFVSLSVKIKISQKTNQHKPNHRRSGCKSWNSKCFSSNPNLNWERQKKKKKKTSLLGTIMYNKKTTSLIYASRENCRSRSTSIQATFWVLETYIQCGEKNKQTSGRKLLDLDKHSEIKRHLRYKT